MKRPEGFDPPGRSQPPAPGRRPTQPVPGTAPPTGRPARRAPQRSPLRPAAIEHPARAERPDGAARADLRRVSRERRRFERAEVRRFTRRARSRRITAGISLGIVASLVLLVVAAIFSPLLALRQISVDGTTRVSADEIQQAIDGQLGTPLALIDYGRLTTELGSFPLIRSYVTEIVPPDTLLVHVTERQPVATLVVNSAYQLVDPAGVTVQESAERIAGVPVIDIGGASTSSPVFESVVDVLLSLPPGLLAQVDSVTARTPDDVSLVLTGVGQRVTWGAAVESARKAALLAALIAVTDPSLAGEFDVSAPGNGVFRPS